MVSCTTEKPLAKITPKQLYHVNACYSSATATQAVAWYAAEKGLFKKYGLDVKLTYINSGSDAVAAMIAQSVDICQVAGSAVVNAAVADEDLVMIAGLFNTYTYSLIVTPNIKAVQDIKGKTLAISEPGSASDSVIRAALKILKLRPEKDVAILAIGGESERLAAMETGQVVGTVVNFPQTAQAKKKGYRILVDMSKLNVPYSHTSISTTKRYIQANREVTLSFMKAIVEAIALMKKDKEGAIAVMAKYLLLDPNKDELSLHEAYNVLIQNNLSKIPYPSLEGIQTILKDLNKENPKAANFQPQDITDMSIIKELETSGFIRNLYN